MKREELLLARLFKAGVRFSKRESAGDELPPGLARRIAAQWAGGGNAPMGDWLWERFALRAAITGMAIAAVLLMASLSWPGQSRAQEARAAAEIELLLSIP